MNTSRLRQESLLRKAMTILLMSKLLLYDNKNNFDEKS